MTAADVLRRLLDEAGVEWHDDGYATTCTVWTANGIVWHGLWRDDCIELIAHLTPEQAIAATLGSCNCSDNCTNSERTETCHDLVHVVRCRDCKFYTPESMTREERGFGVYEDVWEPGGCFNPERCSATWDSIAGQMVSVGIVTEPDGFCAWGERR